METLLNTSTVDFVLSCIGLLLVTIGITQQFVIAAQSKRIQSESDRAEFYYAAYRHVLDFSYSVGLNEDYAEDGVYAGVAEIEDEEDDEDDDPCVEGDDEEDCLDEVDDDRRLAAILAAKRSQFTFDSDGTLVIKPGASVTLRAQRVVFDDEEPTCARIN